LVLKHDSSILKENRKISPPAAAQEVICWFLAAEAVFDPCGITMKQVSL
jgi:hypothetical protein